MSLLGQAWMGLINRLERIGNSSPGNKIHGAQAIIQASKGHGQINRGCRRIGLKYLVEAVVAKDRMEGGV